MNAMMSRVRRRRERTGETRLFGRLPRARHFNVQSRLWRRPFCPAAQINYVFRNHKIMSEYKARDSGKEGVLSVTLTETLDEDASIRSARKNAVVGALFYRFLRMTSFPI